MNRVGKGTVVALSVAALFAARGATPAAAADAAKDAKIECTNDNACSGKGVCASKDGKNSCAGHNSCKGHVASVTAEECTKMGGHPVKK